jgi:SpoIID/LytB domain protein
LTAVTFEGAGWGHGVGMCQMGAIGRAEAGQDYQTILAHYFNGATVAVLYGRGAQSSVAAKSGP